MLLGWTTWWLRWVVSRSKSRSDHVTRTSPPVYPSSCSSSRPRPPHPPSPVSRQTPVGQTSSPHHRGHGPRTRPSRTGLQPPAVISNAWPGSTRHKSPLQTPLLPHFPTTSIPLGVTIRAGLTVRFPVGSGDMSGAFKFLVFYFKYIYLVETYSRFQSQHIQSYSQ